MKKLNNILLILIMSIITSKSLLATPQFAKELNLNCSACHSGVPMLNDMGKMFLRNGFRFSKDDQTTWDKTINQKDSNSTFVPLAVMLGASYKSVTEEIKSKAKIFSAGTLTKKLSYFLSIGKENQKGYLQYNIDTDKHVFRAGILSPFAQVGGINRLSTQSGLKGNNGKDGSISKGKQGTNDLQGKDEGKGNSGSSEGKGNSGSGKGKGNSGSGTGSTTLQSNTKGNNSKYNENKPYKTPLQNSYFREFKGIEYSYLYNYNTLFMVSYGKTLDNSTNKKKDSNSNNNAKNDQDPDSANKYQFVIAIRHQTSNGYYFGIMYDTIKDSEKTNASYIAFIEKTFDKLTLNFTYIYKDNINTNDYTGIENTIRYQLNDTTSVKLIYDIDDDENGFNNKGYSASINKIFYNHLMINIAGAHRKTQSKEQDIIQASINVFF